MAQTLYANSKDVWDWLNKAEKVRDKFIAEGDGSTSVYDIADNDKLISGTFTLKTASDSTSAAALTAGSVTSSLFTIDLDDGRFTLLTASALSGSFMFTDFDKAAVPDSTMQQFLTASSREVDRSTGRNYDLKTTTEFMTPTTRKQLVYYAERFPITSVSSLLFNRADVADSEDWFTASSGIGNDYLLTDRDKRLGRFRVIDNHPPVGIDRVKFTFEHGYSSSDRPVEVKTLTVLRNVKMLLENPAFSKTILEGSDTFVPLNTSIIDAEIERLTTQLKRFDSRTVF